ncbi:hypothetical protein A2U01_0006335 [Trifolium medium]|uniref:Uncharacterized protein n=1 Tax=Trifolium medium TaxID=97028 RepID=A0A392MEL9_9FABA|nr:hypothetical protein [Trifolium medium]
MEITLADQSVIHSCGIVEDVLLKIRDLIFPVDFVILDVGVDNESQVILERPVLATSHACINMDDMELMLKIGEVRRTIKVCIKPNAHCCQIGARERKLEGAPLILNQEWEETSPESERRLEREWMENAPLWETDPSEGIEPLVIEELAFTPHNEQMDRVGEPAFHTEEELIGMRMDREEEEEKAKWWLDRMSEEILMKWNVNHPEPKQFVPKPKPRQHKQWIKNWNIHYKMTTKSKFGMKKKPITMRMKRKSRY